LPGNDGLANKRNAQKSPAIGKIPSNFSTLLMGISYYLSCFSICKKIEKV